MVAKCDHRKVEHFCPSFASPTMPTEPPVTKKTLELGPPLCERPSSRVTFSLDVESARLTGSASSIPDPVPRRGRSD